MIIGLFIAVLAVSAVASASALAATPGWMVAGTNITAATPLATTAKTDENAVLKSAAGTIECSGETLNGVSPQIEPGTTGMGSATKLEFTGCVLLNGGACSIKSTIPTTPILVEATLEGALAVVATFKPKTGTQFASVTFEGVECAESGDVDPINGQAKILAPTGQDERTLQLIKAITTEASKELIFGSAAASLTGSALLKLASGKPWSYL